MADYRRTTTRQSVASTPITERQRINEHGQVVEDVEETVEAPPSDKAAASLTAIETAHGQIQAIYETMKAVENSDELADFLFKQQQAELSLQSLRTYTEAQQHAQEESSHASA